MHGCRIWVLKSVLPKQGTAFPSPCTKKTRPIGRCERKISDHERSSESLVLGCSNIYASRARPSLVSVEVYRRELYNTSNEDPQALGPLLNPTRLANKQVYIVTHTSPRSIACLGDAFIEVDLFFLMLSVFLQIATGGPTAYVHGMYARISFFFSTLTHRHQSDVRQEEGNTSAHLCIQLFRSKPEFPLVRVKCMAMMMRNASHLISS